LHKKSVVSLFSFIGRYSLILPWRPLRPLRENFTEWVSRQGRNERNKELPIALGDLCARCVKISEINHQPALMPDDQAGDDDVEDLCEESFLGGIFGTHGG